MLVVVELLVVSETAAVSLFCLVELVVGGSVVTGGMYGDIGSSLSAASDDMKMACIVVSGVSCKTLSVRRRYLGE